MKRGPTEPMGASSAKLHWRALFGHETFCSSEHQQQVTSHSAMQESGCWYDADEPECLSSIHDFGFRSDATKQAMTQANLTP
jgi:hypothetical protein